jgi:hypothetical protein
MSKRLNDGRILASKSRRLMRGVFIEIPDSPPKRVFEIRADEQTSRRLLSFNQSHITYSSHVHSRVLYHLYSRRTLILTVYFNKTHSLTATSFTCKVRRIQWSPDPAYQTPSGIRIVVLGSRFEGPRTGGGLLFACVFWRAALSSLITLTIIGSFLHDDNGQILASRLLLPSETHP